MTVADEYEIETASGSLQERSLRVTELLLGAGAHVLTKNDRNSTPLDVASGDGVRVLLLSAVQALQRQQEEEEAEAERLGAARARAKLSGGSSGDQPELANGAAPQGSPAAAGGGVGGWGGWKPSAAIGTSSAAFSAVKSSSNNSGSSSFGSQAVVGGTKKKIVIKLKKRS